MAKPRLAHRRAAHSGEACLGLLREGLGCWFAQDYVQTLKERCNPGLRLGTPIFYSKKSAQPCPGVTPRERQVGWHIWVGMVLALGVSGCSGWVSEENQYYMRKEWDEFRGHNWRETAGAVSGWDELFPPPARREALAERELCLHKNGENRVTTQTGVSDGLSYRRCVLAPYGDASTSGGVRMKHRPDS